MISPLFFFLSLATGCLMTKDRPEADCTPYYWDSFYEECASDCYDDDDCVDGYFCCDFDAYYYDGECSESQEDACLPER